MLISGIPGLWLDLDLTGAKRYVPNSFVSKCINRSKNQLRNANLVRLSKPDAVLQALTTRCHAMHTLTVQDLGLQSGAFISKIAQASRLTRLTLGEQTVMGIDAVEQMLMSCPALVALECHSVTGSRRAHPPDWAVELPKLEHLMLVRHKDNAFDLGLVSIIPVHAPASTDYRSLPYSRGSPTFAS